MEPKINLPDELKSLSERYAEALTNSILERRVLFYESDQEQGLAFSIDPNILNALIGQQAYGSGAPGTATRNQRVPALINELTQPIRNARRVQGYERDQVLEFVIRRLEDRKTIHAR